MKTNTKQFTVLAAVALAVSGLSIQIKAEESSDPPSPGTAENQDQVAGTGVAGNLLFTDEQGNPRNPTAEELVVASENFQRDLATLAGKNKGKLNVQTHANGATSATIALSKLAFLIVEENEDGSLSYMHATLDEDGNAIPSIAPSQPEM